MRAFVHHNSYSRGMARIIVQDAGTRDDAADAGRNRGVAPPRAGFRAPKGKRSAIPGKHLVLAINQHGNQIQEASLLRDSFFALDRRGWNPGLRSRRAIQSWIHRSQLETLDFPGSGLWQFGNELNDPGIFIGRQPIFDERL